ncbi:MAG TPA: hypothetical protein VMW75_26940 [Thermoanaerobaculia bacterium]|nr:hypothetical protein [Thermoanaerobaculia bacterium]
MARGWESKSVEEQQVGGARAADQGEDLTAEERRRRERLRDRELSRQRVLEELAVTPSAVRRAALEQALAFLDQEIEQLGKP